MEEICKGERSQKSRMLAFLIALSLSGDVSIFFFFKQKTAYEIGTGDWSSDVCSSDLQVDISFERVTSPVSV